LSYSNFSFSDLTIEQLVEGDISALPAPRPAGVSLAAITDVEEQPEQSLFPEGLRRLKGYIYPYLSSLKGTERKEKAYPWPKGAGPDDLPHESSQAGGGEGGNPDLWTPILKVSFSITNTHGPAGAEVAQLYLSYPNSTNLLPDIDAEQTKGRFGNFTFDRPYIGEDQNNGGWDHGWLFSKRVLRGFDKVFLQPGETKKVELVLTRRDLSYWDTQQQNWVIPSRNPVPSVINGEAGSGKFDIAIGASLGDPAALTGEWSRD
jgi:beta-glucosidase